MSRRSGRRLVYALLVLAFAVRHDLWLWDDGRILLGLPVGLLYHVIFCVAVAGLMALLVHVAGSQGGDSGAERGAGR